MIVLAGKNNIAVYALERFVAELGNFGILAIANESDTGKDGWQRSFVKRASELNVKLVSLEEIKGISLDAFISLEFDKIVKPEEIKTKNLFNIHFSLLPCYKGMYTSIWPILNGDEESGVTLHRIDSGIDTGEICGQKFFKLSYHDRSQDLYRKYIEASILLFEENFKAILRGTLNSKPQLSTKSTYYSKKTIDFSNIKIELNTTAWQLQRQVYAFSFREYQVPVIHNKHVASIEITNVRSTLKAGTIIEESIDSVRMATVDYDVLVHTDRLDNVLERIEKRDIIDFAPLMKNIMGINDRNFKGWSAIIVAVYNGNLELVKYLVSAGADINDVNYNGTTVLMYAKDDALKRRDKELFDWLVDKGANTCQKDFKGKSLFDYLTPSEASFLEVI